MFGQAFPRSFVWLLSFYAVLAIGNFGCGEEENSQPIIGAISDITLNIADKTDDEALVEVNLTDADVKDTHSIRASSGNKAIAMVSVNDTTLTISAVSEGTTAITVFATDDSEQVNATAAPVTFHVFVIANSQPVVEALPDVTLTAGTSLEVNLNITDADVDDTHKVYAFSRDKTIVTIGSSGIVATSFPISGEWQGITTIDVYVTDDSGGNNEESTPVTFLVEVKPYKNKGRCIVGMTLVAGESCTYLADNNEVLFYVDNDLGCRGIENEEGKRLRLCVSPEIERDDFFDTSFAAEKNSDGSWTVDRVP